MNFNKMIWIISCQALLIFIDANIINYEGF